MSRKHKNHVDLETSIDLLVNGYGIMTRRMNTYQLRLSLEDEPDTFYDWYHTTGSLVKNKGGWHTSMGKIAEAEDVALFIKKQFYGNV